MRILLTLLLTICAHGAVLRQSLSFGSGQFDWSSRGGYVMVSGRGMELTDEPGAPQLPVVPVVISLPGRRRVTAVEVCASGWKVTGPAGTVFPAQPQRVLGDASATDGFTAPDPLHYNPAEWSPEKPGIWTGTGFRRDSTLVQVLVRPLRHRDGRVELAAEIAVTVEYDEPSGSAHAAGGEMEYVIVTGAGLEPVFARLAEWKTQKGVPAVVRSIEPILAAHPGRDGAERLRNYLKTLPDSGTRWVLLGGDVGVVPFRKAFAMNCEWGAHPREDSLPSDLYFSDLDGTWDANGNGVFGEVDDSVDLLPDVFVGRAPVNDIAQAQAFVEKALDYESGAGTGVEAKALFFAEVLWEDPYTDMGRHKDRIDSESFGPGFAVTRLYQSLGNESREAVMAAMRAGQNFLNHDGHGWIDVMQCGGSRERLRTADAETLTTAYAGVLYSIGCWTTAFDTSSIGEAFVQNPNGGAVAVIGNSSYGWGSPGNPGFGISDKFDSRFWHAVLRGGRPQLGRALAAAKERYIPFSHDRNVYRWHQYCLNLMGDPELAAWTGQPRALVVAAPDDVGLGPARVTVTVSDAGAPVESALVCLMKEGESYGRGRTGRDGRVTLPADAATPGSFTLTVTAPGFFPTELAVNCVEGSVVGVAGFTATDSAGNRDGIANPGETLLLDLVLGNTGTVKSAAVEVVLRCADARVGVLDSVAAADRIPAGETVALVGALRVELGEDIADGELLRFEVEVRDGLNRRHDRPGLIVGTGAARPGRWWLSRPLAPGGTAGVRLRVENAGHGFAYGTWCRLVSLDPDLTVTAESVWCGDIPPLGLVVPAESFAVAARPGAASGRAATARLTISGDGFERSETLRLAIGATGFFDDVESGEGGWSRSGTPGHWHRSQRRAHSGEWAWYAGDSVTGRYANRAEAELVSEPVIAAASCTLSFWRWFRVPNYGVDGVRVILLQGSGADTLDFIGSGGALFDPLAGIESGWAEERYSLDGIVPAGESFRLKFAFASDRDTTDEGVYIDDVRLSGGESPLTAVEAIRSADVEPAGLSVVPSVAAGRVMLRHDGGAVVRIRDIRGALVCELALRAGAAAWNRRDARGRAVAPGLYFAESRTAAGTSRKKFVLVR